ncbi:MAG: hypothetical protein JSW28_05310 [Thermoplasmata archaeon]|nr:MAG: hypothetical protein JSW28_05310 [Thermoplasmata archaeon]
MDEDKDIGLVPGGYPQGLGPFCNHTYIASKSFPRIGKITNTVTQMGTAGAYLGRIPCIPEDISRLIPKFDTKRLENHLRGALHEDIPISNLPLYYCVS